MKVGLISFHTFSRPGGVKRHILALENEFQKREILTRVIVPRRKKSEDYGKNVILLGTSLPFPFTGCQSDFCINFNPLAVKKILQEEKFDILHFHNFGLPSAWQILERSGALNILTFHANVEENEFLKNFPIFLYIFKEIVRWKIDGIIGVSPLALRVFKDYSGPKIIIPNGVDLEEFNPQVSKIKKYIDGKINILFVGRIEERKGLIYLLKAYEILEKKHSNLRLIVVGDGNLKRDCENFVKERKLKEVCFEGEKTGKELPSYFTSSDIFVGPAIFGETFGMVLLEAMASKIPIVAFANRAYREFLKDKEKAVFLVKNKDWQALSKKIEILIKNPQLREEMGEKGRIEAQKFSWDKIANQVLDFYELCKKEKGGRKKRKKLFLMKKYFKKIYNKKLLDWLKSRSWS